MTKMELVDRIADRTGVSKRKSRKTVNALIEIIRAELTAGGRLNLPGFGTFDTGHRQARNGRNPRTGESVWIPARTTARFRAGKRLKDILGQLFPYSPHAGRPPPK